MLSGKTPSPVVFRRGGPGDFEGLIKLNRQIYGGRLEADRNIFDWAYAKGPDGPAIIFVASAGDRVVGCYILCLHTMSVFGRPCLVTLSVGSVVHEDYRRHMTREGGRLRTVFARLADLAYEECAQRGIALTYAFPNANSYPTFVKHLDFKDMGPLPFYAKPVRPGATLGQRLPLPGGLGRGLGRAVDPFFRLLDLRPRPRLPATMRIEQMTGADDRSDALWERCQPTPGIIRKRDRAYLQWRMFDHPSREYQVWMAAEGPDPVAYVAAVTIEQHDRTGGTSYRLGHIVDFLCAPHAQAPAILSGLIHHACRNLQQEPIEFIIAGHSGPGEGQQGLRKSGLHLFSPRRAPRTWPCVVRVHRSDVVPESDSLYQRDKWYFNLSDNDIV